MGRSAGLKLVLISQAEADLNTKDVDLRARDWKFFDPATKKGFFVVDSEEREVTFSPRWLLTRHNDLTTAEDLEQLRRLQSGPEDRKK